MDFGEAMMGRDWNKAYEEGDTPWDKGYASPPLEEFLARHAVTGRVLVPGCGTGHDARLLAAQGAQVVGLDIVPAAVDKARGCPPVENLSFTVRDFLTLDTAHAGFYDWVVEHTCLCAIEPEMRRAYVDSVLRALKPGGHYLAVFFREVSDYTGDGPPHPISRAETEALFGSHFDCLESFIPEKSYPSRPFGAEEVVWWRLR